MVTGNKVFIESCFWKVEEYKDVAVFKLVELRRNFVNPDRPAWIPDFVTKVPNAFFSDHQFIIFRTYLIRKENHPFKHFIECVFVRLLSNCPDNAPILILKIFENKLERIYRGMRQKK